ncbi:MAG: peptidylprolyl isomerase [Granulosicoccus sp.]
MSFRSAAAFITLLTIALFFSSAAIAQSSPDKNSTDNTNANPKIVIRTTLGDMVVELDRERAPRTVENFLAYVDDNFYADTIFHRVIEGFMIQGGGFSTNYQRKTTRSPISNEAYNGLRNRHYTIAMARTTAPHSATSQFFINSQNNSNLDHTATTQRGWGYTVFGRVIQGEDVVDTISRVRTGPGGPFSRDVPSEPIVIMSVDRWPAESAEDELTGDINTESGEPAKGAAAADPIEAVIQNVQTTLGGNKTSVDISDNKDDVSSEIIKQN